MINKKDIIEMNKQFDKGRFINEASLDFAFSNLEQTKDWLKESAYLTRAILIDHVFEEGNKRTTALLIRSILETKKLAYDPQKINALVIIILKKNINKVNEIKRLIKDAIR
ncbi:MAG TPA: hypothetical protein VJJ21_05185 [Candidatus Nanoarchaeia archaeon]|nr:hypothetical protein [Candidatus Nanoarchaeia archaeon]